MELLAPLLHRSVIVALAIGGCVIAVIGSVLLRRGSSANPKLARFILRSGYAISWASVALFITTGFIGADW